MKISTMLAGCAALVLAGCGESGKTADAAAGTTMAATSAAAMSPGAKDWTTTVVQTPEGGFRMGNPNAKVKIVEYASMTCHVCRDFSAEATQALEEKYVKTGQVSFEFRNFLRDPLDAAASLLARCQGPAPFFKLTEQLFTEQDAMLARAQALSPADVKSMEGLKPGQEMTRLGQLAGLDKFVGMRGIPAAKANACLSNEAELNRMVAANQTATKNYKISGTPTFLLNGQPQNPPLASTTFWKDLEVKIKTALAA